MKKYLEHIGIDPAVMVGKPVVKGTRIPVERVIGHLADTLDLNDLFAAFPDLTIKDVKRLFPTICGIFSSPSVDAPEEQCHPE